MGILFSILVILSMVANPVKALQDFTPANSVRMVVAPNDNFADAAVISSLPFHYPLSSFEATEEATDPTSAMCGLNPGFETTWYKYIPSANIAVHMDTFGSTFDTYILLFTESGGVLTEIACNDDAGASFQSAINITLTAGVTYYINVALSNGAIMDGADGKSGKTSEASLLGTGTEYMFRLVQLYQAGFKSIALHDGFILEKNETAGTGLIKYPNLAYLRVGDDEKKRQYRAILSFNTAALPDGAMIASGFIKLKKNTATPGDIFNKLGLLKLYVGTPSFGTVLGLESIDFNSPAIIAGTFSKTAILGWYKAKLLSTSLSNVSTTAKTQYRVQFTKDDNNNTVADYMRFYSGETGSKPTLFLKYYIP
jgi:hypothetical protein